MDSPLEHIGPRLVDRDRDWPSRVPAPSHRHAAPSGPWPWQDLDDPIPPTRKSTDGSSRETLASPVSVRWDEYPECLFPNWKADQVERSKMKTELQGSKESTIYHIDVDEKGRFSDRGSHLVQSENKEQFDKVMAEIVSVTIICLLHIHLESELVKTLPRSCILLGKSFNFCNANDWNQVHVSLLLIEITLTQSQI